jgi:sugar lactone lactonase YvrE
MPRATVLRVAVLAAAARAQVVSTLAGSGEGGAGRDGLGTNAGFYSPGGAATGSDGTVYVSDLRSIRAVTPAGAVRTVPAAFSFVQNVAVAADGTLFTADINVNIVFAISSAGVVRTLAGSGACASVDGEGTDASFSSPSAVAVASDGTVYVTDRNFPRIRAITPTGVVSSLAGSGTFGFADGAGTSASFQWPNGVAIGADGGTLYITDSCRIRAVTLAGGVTRTFAGSGAGFADGVGTNAVFSGMYGSVAVASDGTLYLSDTGNSRIRSISPTGTVRTIAGSGTNGFADGSGMNASFFYPNGVTLSADGNVIVVDSGNYRIRVITMPPPSPTASAAPSPLLPSPTALPSLSPSLSPSTPPPPDAPPDAPAWRLPVFAGAGAALGALGLSVCAYCARTAQAGARAPAVAAAGAAEPLLLDFHEPAAFATEQRAVGLVD